MPADSFLPQQPDVHLQFIGPQWKAVVQGCDTKLTRKYLAICYYVLIEGPQNRIKLKALFFPRLKKSSIFRVHLHRLRQAGLIQKEQDPIQLIKEVNSDLEYLNQLQQRKDHLSIRDIYRIPYPSLRDSLEIQEACNFSDEFYEWIEQQQRQQEKTVFYSRLELAQNTNHEGKSKQAIKYAEEAYLFLKSLHFDISCDEEDIFYTYLAKLEYLLGDDESQAKTDFKIQLKEFNIIMPTSIYPKIIIDANKEKSHKERKKPKSDFNLLAIYYIKGGRPDDLAHQIILDGYQKIISGSPETCLNLSRTCHFIIDKISHEELRFRILNLQGLALLHAGQPLKAEYLYRSALTEVTSNEKKIEKYRAIFLSNLCLSLSRQRKHNEAYRVQREAYYLSTQHRDFQTQVIDLSLLSRISLQLQHRDVALEQLRHADTILGPVDQFDFRDVHFAGHRSLIYAQAYAEQGQIEQALPYIVQADYIFQKNEEPRGHMFTLVTEAKVMFEAQRYHIAWEKLQQAKEYALLLGYTEPFDETFILDVFGFSPIKLQILANR